MLNFTVKPRTPGIYKITNTLTGFVYIGSSKDVRARWRQHTSELNRGKHHCAHLQNSWKLHGESAFEFELIVRCANRVLALSVEDALIRSFEGPGLFNSFKGAVGAFHTPESRKKIGDALRGQPLAQTTKDKISAALTGSTQSETHRAKRGDRFRGLPLTAATRAKMAMVRTGKVASPETRARMSAASSLAWIARRARA